MTPIDWPREVIIPLIVALVSLIGGIGIAAKTLLPRLADTFIAGKQKQLDAEIADRQAKREAETEEEANERALNTALLSQVVQLTMANQNQNRDLIKFITERVDGTIQANQAEIRIKLDDIDRRWVAVANKLDNPAILAGEITRLGDSVRELNTFVRSSLNGSLNKQG